MRDQVYDRLLDMLMSNAMKPGERLAIETLAARLNVSPTPVREAMVQMERTGLVTRQGFKGYRVAEPLTEVQMIELMDAREMLEVQATRWAVKLLPELLPDLRRTHAEHSAATTEVLDRLRTQPVDLRTYREYFAADEAFHAVIIRFARNGFLAQMSADLGAHLHRLRQMLIRGEYDVAQALAEHAAILQAAESLDGAAMTKAMQSHLRGVRARSTHSFRTVDPNG